MRHGRVLSTTFLQICSRSLSIRSVARWKSLRQGRRAKSEYTPQGRGQVHATKFPSVHHFSYSLLQPSTLRPGVISSGNAWERRSQSYFDSGNGVPRNGVPRNEIVR